MSLYGKAGVYCITNIVSGRRYVGSSVNIGRRFSVHLSTLATGSNPNRELQADWNRLGIACFQFDVLCFVDGGPDALLAAEQAELDKLTIGVDAYNVQPVAGTAKGQKLRHRRVGTDTHREIARRIGSAPKSAEHRARIAAAKLGKPASEAARASLRAAWVKRKQRMEDGRDRPRG